MLTMRFFTWCFGHYVGKDEFGNLYYAYKKSGYNRERRWVVYAGIPEASKIPPLWFSWLHHTTKNPPSICPQRPSYFWEKPHKPNLTGTPFAFVPTPPSGSYQERVWSPQDLPAKKLAKNSPGDTCLSG